MCSQDTPFDLRELALSPDGRYLAVRARSSEGAGAGLWIYDLERGVEALVVANQNFVRPSWSPDGRMLAFVTTPTVVEPTSSSLHVLHVGQGQQPRKLAEPARWGFPSWTPDRRTILFVRGSDDGTEIVSVPSDASAPPAPIRRIPHLRGTISLSPDGSLLAYEVGSVGRELVIVTSFPDFSSQVQISGEGAKNPEWSPKGDEVWFTQGNKRDQFGGNHSERGVAHHLRGRLVCDQSIVERHLLV